jgi:hypothetical protein
MGHVINERMKEMLLVLLPHFKCNCITDGPCNLSDIWTYLYNWYQEEFVRVIEQLCSRVSPATSSFVSGLCILFAHTGCRSGTFCGSFAFRLIFPQIATREAKGRECWIRHKGSTFAFIFAHPLPWAVLTSGLGDVKQCRRMKVNGSDSGVVTWFPNFIHRPKF